MMKKPYNKNQKKVEEDKFKLFVLAKATFCQIRSIKLKLEKSQ